MALFEAELRFPGVLGLRDWGLHGVTYSRDEALAAAVLPPQPPVIALSAALDHFALAKRHLVQVCRGVAVERLHKMSSMHSHVSLQRGPRRRIEGCHQFRGGRIAQFKQ